VKHLGRTWCSNDVTYLSMSGSGIEFEYEGKGLTLTFISGSVAREEGWVNVFARIAIYVDDKRVIDHMLI